MSKKLAKCPLCSKSMGVRGLGGHLRFLHKLDGDESRRLQAVAAKSAVKHKPPRRGRVARILELLDCVEQVAACRQGVHDSDAEVVNRESPARAKESESATALALGALDRVEQQLLAELERLGQRKDRDDGPA